MNNKLLLMGICFLGFNSFSQTTVFQTTNDYSAWTFHDADLDGNDWASIDLTSYGAPFDTQANMLVSYSNSQINGPLLPDNWVISAPIDATGYDNLVLSWTRGSGSYPNPEDNYSVYVVQEDIAANIMPTLLAATAVDQEAVPTGFNLVPKMINLNSLNNLDNLYIAFRHHNCSGKSFIAIDDIKIVGNLMSAGISENDIHVKTYPNPVENTLTIESSEKINAISILNLNGAVVYQSSNVQNSLTLDVSTFDAGLYFLEVTTDHGTTTSKITKK